MRIESVEPRPRLASEEDRHAAPPPPAQHRPTGASDATIDASLRLYAQNATSPRDVIDASGGPSFNDRVMYVGMNTDERQCDREARAIGGVVIGHSERDKALGADKVRVGDRVVDLATDAGAVEFAQSLGLPDAQANIVANVIRHAWPGGRDELAAIARVWAQGEKGGSVPSRLVLSGHCYGDAIWDGGSKENLGVLAFENLRALAASMPRASAQVEDLMISACSSGFAGAEAIDRKQSLTVWKSAFPNLKTAWGYGSANDWHSPTSQQAVMHIQAWEHATRGRVQTLDGKRAVDSYFEQVRRANPGVTIDAPQFDGNVSVWTQSQGYVEGKG